MKYKNSVNYDHHISIDEFFAQVQNHQKDREKKDHSNIDIDKSRTNLNKSKVYISNEKINQLREENHKLYKNNNDQKKTKHITEIVITMGVNELNFCKDENNKHIDWTLGIDFSNSRKKEKHSIKSFFINKNKQASKKIDIDNFINDVYAWTDIIDQELKNQFGNTYIGYDLNLDETSPHIHAYVLNQELEHKQEWREAKKRKELPLNDPNYRISKNDKGKEIIEKKTDLFLKYNQSYNWWNKKKLNEPSERAIQLRKGIEAANIKFCKREDNNFNYELLPDEKNEDKEFLIDTKNVNQFKSGDYSFKRNEKYNQDKKKYEDQIKKDINNKFLNQISNLKNEINDLNQKIDWDQELKNQSLKIENNNLSKSKNELEKLLKQKEDDNSFYIKLIENSKDEETKEAFEKYQNKNQGQGQK